MSEMKSIFGKLFAHEVLTKEEAYVTMLGIGKGDIPQGQVAAFLGAMAMRGIHVEELEGLRQAMLEMCLHVDLSDFDPMDLCGTGGDGKNTFNISTTSAFVVAGAGIAVAKHGNYGVSSGIGSSNVLEQLGITFTNDKDALRKQLEKANICILHAPQFHPAMKQVGPLRKELAFKTFFNMLGPLVNPAHVKKQMVGVFSLSLARLYGYLFQQTDAKYSIIHAMDGYDEVSLTGAVKVMSAGGEERLTPADFDLPRLMPAQIKSGETIAESTEILLSVLENRATEAQTAAVLANASLAIRTAKPDLSLLEAVAVARESIESGNGRLALKNLLEA